MLLNAIFSIWALVSLVASIRKRRALMQGTPQRAGRFLARFVLVAALFFTSGFLAAFAAMFVWYDLLGFDAPGPVGPAMPFFDLWMPAWLWLTVLGHKLTRRWFGGPTQGGPSAPQ